MLLFLYLYYLLLLQTT